MEGRALGVEQSGDEGRQQHEQYQRHAQGQDHREGHQHILQLFRRDVLFQPLVKLAGLGALVIGEVVRREHQRLDAGDDGADEGGHAPDDGPAQNGEFILDEFPLRHLGDQPLGGADDDGVLLRPAHEDALDQRLAANGGAEGFLLFFCHGSSFLTSIAQNF